MARPSEADSIEKARTGGFAPSRRNPAKFFEISRDARNRMQKSPPDGRALYAAASSAELFLLELGVDHIVATFARVAGRARSRVRTGRGAIGLLGDLLHRRLELGEPRRDRVIIFAADRIPKRLHLLVDLDDLGLIELIFQLFEALLDLVAELVGAVACLNLLAALLILFLVRLGLVDHLLDLFLGETRTGRDGDLLILTGRLIARRHVQNTVGVNIEGDLDLGNTARSGRDALEVEASEALIEARFGSLSLKDVDFDLRLVVVRGRVDLLLLGGDRRIARDHHRHHAAERLDTEAERGDVKEDDILHIAAEHARLDGSAERDDLVRVHAPMRILAEELLHRLLNEWDPGRTSNEDHLVDVRGRLLRVRERLFTGLKRALNQRLDHRLELCPGEPDIHVLRTRRIRGEEREIHLRLEFARQLDLRLLGGVLQALKDHLIVRDIDAGIAPKFLDEIIDDRLIDIISAELCITVGRDDVDDVTADLEDRNIEGPAAEVVNDDEVVILLIEAVSERGCGRFVDDPLDIETGDFTRILGRLALRVVEIRRDRDHGLGHALTQIILGRLLELAEDVCAHLGRRDALIADLKADVSIRTTLELIRHPFLGDIDLVVASRSEERRV